MVKITTGDLIQMFGMSLFLYLIAVYLLPNIKPPQISAIFALGLCSGAFIMAVYIERVKKQHIKGD